MRRLFHISDLHFGRIDPRIVEALLEDIHRFRPDFAAVSGDLTQRARGAQFAEAAAFLRRLPCPFIAVPGNHDIPLYHLPRRLLQPLSGYKRFIHEESEPFFEDNEIFVAGINTATRWRWKEGRLRTKQIERLRELMAKAPRESIKILVMHHPPWGGLPAIQKLLLNEPDLVLSGHLHKGEAQLHPGGAIMVGAGTATSTRLRGEKNAYNVIDIYPGKEAGGLSRITIGVRVWDGERFVFESDLDSGTERSSPDSLPQLRGSLQTFFGFSGKWKMSEKRPESSPPP